MYNGLPVFLLHAGVPKKANKDGSNMYNTYKNLFREFMKLNMHTISVPMLGININAIDPIISSRALYEALKTIPSDKNITVIVPFISDGQNTRSFMNEFEKSAVSESIYTKNQSYVGMVQDVFFPPKSATDVLTRDTTSAMSKSAAISTGISTGISTDRSTRFLDDNTNGTQEFFRTLPEYFLTEEQTRDTGSHRGYIDALKQRSQKRSQFINNSSEGFQFYYVAVSGDGSCFYTSLAVGLIYLYGRVKLPVYENKPELLHRTILERYTDKNLEYVYFDKVTEKMFQKLRNIVVYEYFSIIKTYEGMTVQQIIQNDFLSLTRRIYYTFKILRLGNLCKEKT